MYPEAQRNSQGVVIDVIDAGRARDVLQQLQQQQSLLPDTISWGRRDGMLEAFTEIQNPISGTPEKFLLLRVNDGLNIRRQQRLRLIDTTLKETFGEDVREIFPVFIRSAANFYREENKAQKANKEASKPSHSKGNSETRMTTVPASRPQRIPEFDGVEPVEIQINRVVQAFIQTQAMGLMIGDPEAKDMVRQLGLEKLRGPLLRAQNNNAVSEFRALCRVNKEARIQLTDILEHQLSWSQIYETYRSNHPNIPELMSVEGLQLFFEKIFPEVVGRVLAAHRVTTKIANTVVAERTNELDQKLALQGQDLRKGLRIKIADDNLEATVRELVNGARVAETKTANVDTITAGSHAEGAMNGARVAKNVHIIREILRALAHLPAGLPKGLGESIEEWARRDRVLAAVGGIGIGVGMTGGTVLGAYVAQWALAAGMTTPEALIYAGLSWLATTLGVPSTLVSIVSGVRGVRGGVRQVQGTLSQKQ